MSDKKLFTIKALALNFVQINKPNKFQKYSVQIAVDKAEKKRITKSFPNFKKTFKEYDPEEYLERFKVETPLPDADEVFVLTLDQNVAYKNKQGQWEKFDRPKVYLDEGEGKAREITGTNVGNGSTGFVLATYRQTENEGIAIDVLNLKAVKVVDFVEYSGGESASEDDVMSEFGFTEVEAQDFEEPEDNFKEPEPDNDDEEDDDY